MAWRKWLVRSLVFSITAGLAVAGFFYQRWTDPEKVRAQVLEHLNRRFVGARFSAESARFHLFGGITVTDVRMTRRDDPNQTEFAYVPTLTIYLDKEQLLHGRQNVRKLELERPRLRLIRGADGAWNLDGLLGAVDPTETVPTVVIHHGTVVLEDHQTAAQAPPIEIKDVGLTILNDPILVLSFAGSGSSDLGPIQIAVNHQRVNHDTELTLEALAVPVGPALIQRLATYNPELATHARRLEGLGKLHAELAYRPKSSQPWTHDVQFQLRQGKFSHARLPVPLEQVEGSIQCTGGRVPSLRVAASSGAARMELAIKDLDYARVDDGLERAVGEMDLQIRHLPLTQDVFAALPASFASLHDLERDYEPRGPISLEYTLRRDPSGGWRKRSVVKPEDVRAEFVKFPYPLEHLTGVLEQEGANDVPDVLKIELTGRAGGRPISIRGEVRDQAPAAGLPGGKKPPSFVDVDIRGDNVRLDEKLLAALVPKGQTASKSHDLARAFHPAGAADFQAFIRRDGRSRQFANHYVVNFHHATLRYDAFAYPLENVTGTLEIQPNYWEFHDFRGTHDGGEFHGRGRSFPTPEGDRAEVFLDGANLRLGDELKAALDEELQRTWTKFHPTGRVDFTARIEIPADSSKPHKPEVELDVRARGCSIRPDFFKYAIRDLTGKVRYTKRWVMLDDMQGRHGESVLALKEGLVFLKEGGGVWAQLGRLQGTPLVPDDEFLKALPDCLTKACNSLQWRDPAQLDTKLVIDTRPDHAQPVIYWDGSATFQNAVLKTGVDLTDVSGTVACLGLHDGRRLQGLVGNIALDQATMFKQPLRAIHSRLEVTKEEPDVLKLPGLYAQFCGGEVYGPIRVELGSTVRYELNLTASRVKLEEFARQNPGLKSELSGEATAQLYLSGRGENPDELKGNGRIDVPKGKIENLPPLVNLLKFLALRLPDRTAFEEAHAEFEIQGQRARVMRLDLFGNAISLRGQGDLRLDGGDLNLDFNADWARSHRCCRPASTRFLRPSAINSCALRCAATSPTPSSRKTSSRS
jgi:hypothetical protein